MSLQSMKMRLGYHGRTTKDRFISDKLRSLRSALTRSYQRETIVLQDGREFFCLINPEKLKNDYDEKIISIPFDDICLNKIQTVAQKTTEGREIIGLKDGDTFLWKEDNSHWICYLRRKQEPAYYKAIIRQCDYEIEINNGSKYWVYTRGPLEQSLQNNSKDNIIWNGLNYTAMITITKNEETENYFHRFSKLKVNNKNWKVVAVDNMSTEGIIDVYLDEDYTNSIQDAIDEEEKNKPIAPPPPEDAPAIIGEIEIYPYDIQTYNIKNTTGGTWMVDTNKVKITSQNEEQVTIEVLTGKGLSFNLIYKQINSENIILPIVIKSF